MYFATAIGLGHLAGFVGTLLIFLSFWIKLRDEEQLMLQQFPERYAAYRQRAKRIIPFIL
jgi:protein-S-isoprenylcysteine O-methyltransferase Ste14